MSPCSVFLCTTLFFVGIASAEQVQNQLPRYIFISGSSDGIGRQTAYQLAQDLNNRIILHGRNQSRCDTAVRWVRARVRNANLTCVTGDFRSLNQIDPLVNQIRAITSRLNVALMNAGIWAKTRVLTNDGYEETFQVNHLAHFLLAQKLIELLKQGKPSRLLFTSSVVHFAVPNNEQWNNYNAEPFDYLQVYGRSKVYNVMTAKKLSDQLAGTGISVNAFHPGIWRTKLINWVGVDVVGVRTPAYLATSPEVENITGKYYNDDNTEQQPSAVALDAAKRDQLFSNSTNIICRINSGTQYPCVI